MSRGNHLKATKTKMNELKDKIKAIVSSYLRNYQPEFTAFRKQQQYKKSQLKNEWAEMKGTDVMVRQLNEYPETLFALFKIGLSDAEFLEFKDTKMQIWFGREYRDFSAIEGKL